MQVSNKKQALPAISFFLVILLCLFPTLEVESITFLQNISELLSNYVGYHPRTSLHVLLVLRLICVSHIILVCINIIAYNKKIR
jgi:hypothetical protein